MASENLVVICPRCGAKNRIPRDRWGERATCGKCHAPLPSSAAYPDRTGEVFDWNFKSGNSLAFCKAVKSPFIPLFQRGKKWKGFSIESPKALLPLKNEDGRDFWQGLFKALKCYQERSLGLPGLGGSGILCSRVWLLPEAGAGHRRGRQGIRRTGEGGSAKHRPQWEDRLRIRNPKRPNHLFLQEWKINGPRAGSTAERRN